MKMFFATVIASALFYGIILAFMSVLFLCAVVIMPIGITVGVAVALRRCLIVFLKLWKREPTVRFASLRRGVISDSVAFKINS